MPRLSHPLGTRAQPPQRFSLGAAFLALMLLSPAAASRAEGRIVLLVSGGHAAYEEASRTARQALEESLHNINVDVVELDEGLKTAAGGAATNRLDDPSVPALVVAIGSHAARVARQVAPDAPLVYGMVLDPVALGPDANATGVTMDVPPDVQLELIRQLVPSARRIGILYDPLISGAAVRKASAAARQLGLVVVPQPVRNESEVLEAARLLAPATDVFWALADPTVLTATTSRALILQCLRSRRPLFAPSESFVQTGALAAVRADAREVGRRTGEVASQLLRGGSVGAMRPEPPPRYSIYLNRAVAEHLGIPIPGDLAARAEAIYPRP